MNELIKENKRLHSDIKGLKIELDDTKNYLQAKIIEVGVLKEGIKVQNYMKMKKKLEKIEEYRKQIEKDGLAQGFNRDDYDSALLDVSDKLNQILGNEWKEPYSRPSLWEGKE